VEAYEYIFAALVMMAVFTAAAYLAVTVLPLYRSVSEVDQLKIAAQKVVNNLLLNPGYPHDWGSDLSVKAGDLASFGLASYTTLTREAYVLDQDKVQRLSREVPDPLYVPPSVALALLGLGLDYGIRLEFVPVLNVIVEPPQGPNVVVRVTSAQGLPIEDANVTVVAVYASGGGLSSSRHSGRTDVNGACALNLGSPLPALLITVVDHHSMRAVNVSVTGLGVHKSLLVGKSLVVSKSVDPGNGLDQKTAYQLFLSTGPEESLQVNIVSSKLNVKDLDLGDYNVYDMDFEEPNLLAVVVVLDNDELLVAYRLVPKSYSSIAGEVHPPISYTLERSVRIGLSHYNLRLMIWRMSW